jgi:hypothetical protein
MRTKMGTEIKERRDGCDILVQMLKKFKMRGAMASQSDVGIPVQLCEECGGKLGFKFVFAKS